ncbi:hypothetical protein H0H92_014418 [Tricholoma furcatifolium]|nr:hypothetical protein H0H92_014418 [Tricholoma furcatifolium]
MPDKKWGRGEKMATRNKIIQDLWEKENDPIVKQAVEDHLLQLIKEREAASQTSQETPTPEAYLEAIKEIPSFLGPVLHGLRQRTGWAFSVLMGGPDPSINGDINVASFHVGENHSRLDFSKAVPNFERSFMEPYTEFLVTVYSPETRRARALGAIREGDAQQKDGSLTAENKAHASLGSTATGPTPASNISPAVIQTPSTSWTLPPSLASNTSPVAIQTRSPSLTPPAPQPTIIQTPAVITPIAISPPAVVTVVTPTAPADLGMSTPIAISPPAIVTVVTPTAPANLGVSDSPSIPARAPSLAAPAITEAVDFDEFLASLNNPAVASGNGPDDFGLFSGTLDDYNWSPDFFTKLLNSSNTTNLSLSPSFPLLDSSSPIESPLRPSVAINSAVLPDPASRSVRNRVASKRHDQMNMIGSNGPGRKGKENIPPEESTPERPAWRYPAEAHLLMVDMGTEWSKCVNAWIALEDSLPSASRAGLVVKSRPEEWQKWASKTMNGSRIYAATPAINDPLEFGYAVMVWWKSLQPEFRSTSDVLPAPSYDPPAVGEADPWLSLCKGWPQRFGGRLDSFELVGPGPPR